jgi:hypothetical protein
MFVSCDRLAAGLAAAPAAGRWLQGMGWSCALPSPPTAARGTRRTDLEQSVLEKGLDHQTLQKEIDALRLDTRALQEGERTHTPTFETAGGMRTRRMAPRANESLLHGDRFPHVPLMARPWCTAG